MDKKIKIGIVGCGNILGQYAHGCRSFDILEIQACSDIVIEKAEQAAVEFDIPRVYSYAQLL